MHGDADDPDAGEAPESAPAATGADESAAADARSDGGDESDATEAASADADVDEASADATEGASADADVDEASSAESGVDTEHVMNLTFVLTLLAGVPTVVVLSLFVPLDGWAEIIGFVVRVGAAIWFLTAISLYVRERIRR